MLKNLSTQEMPLMNMVGTAKVQEKLLLQGRRALSEIELLALILNNSANCKLSVQTATKILNYCENNLQELQSEQPEERAGFEKKNNGFMSNNSRFNRKKTLYKFF